MGGRAVNSRTYTERPRSGTARQAWDFFVKQEANPRPRDVYGNMGSRGTVTTHIDPPQNRIPKEMWRAHMDYWVWVMQMTNGEFEEMDCAVFRGSFR